MVIAPYLLTANFLTKEKPEFLILKIKNKTDIYLFQEQVKN